jgi:hypothetical protein
MSCVELGAGRHVVFNANETYFQLTEQLRNKKERAAAGAARSSFLRSAVLSF